MNKLHPSKHRGVVLLLVLGVLALLSVLATSYVSMARLERSISTNYVDRTRALMVAESGVEYALARIDSFRGGVLSLEEALDMAWVGGDPTGPVDEGGKASFQLTDQTVPMSGILGGSYAPGGDYYVLRVQDLSGRLNLNDSNGSWNIDTDPYYDPDDDPELLNAPNRLEVIVETLGDILFDPGTGTQIVNALFNTDPLLIHSRPNQPGNRFSDIEQVRAALMTPYPSLGLSAALSDAADVETFLSHVTLWSWQDPNVIRPTFQLKIDGSPAGGITFPDPTEVPISSANYDGYDVYTWKDFQTKYFDLEPRSPVNVNTASPELLQALITDVQGWTLREGPGNRLTNGRYGSYACSAPRFVHEDKHLSPSDDAQLINPIDLYNGTTSGTHYEGKVVGQIGIYNFGYEWGKSNILGMARWSPPAQYPDQLATVLWDRIHNVDTDGDGFPGAGDDTGPFATWEEFEHFLRTNSFAREAIEVDQPALLSGFFNDANENRQFPLPKDLSPMPADENLATGELALPPPASPLPLVHEPTDCFLLDFSGFPTLPPREKWYADYLYDIQVDALLANFNPNAQTSDYSNSLRSRRRVDKAHLVKYTTEFCFEPTGYFSIESLGVLQAADGRKISSASIQSVAKVFEIFRQTTQRQFMGEATEYLDLDFLRNPATGVFVESPKFTTAGAGMVPNHKGFTLQSFPEPLHHPTVWESMPFDPLQPAGTLREATPTQWSPFDGSIRLAVWQPDLEPEGVRYQHHFNGTLRWTKDTVPGAYGLYMGLAGFNGGGGAGAAEDGMFILGSEDMKPFQRNTPTETKLMYSKEEYENYLDTAGFEPTPGNLYPDGAFSEAGRTVSLPLKNLGDPAPAKLGAVSSPGSIGALEFWIKPIFSGDTSRVHKFFTANSSYRQCPHDFAALGMTGNIPYMRQFSCYYFAHNYPDDIYTDTFLNAGDGQLWYNPGSTDFIQESKVSTVCYRDPRGIYPRSIAVGYGGLYDTVYNSDHCVWSRNTLPVSHDFPGHTEKFHGDNFHFEGHCWNHIALNWYMVAPPARAGWGLLDYLLYSPQPQEKLNVVVNGQEVVDAVNVLDDPELTGNSSGHNGEALTYNLYGETNPAAANYYLRFGEFTTEDGFTPLRECFSADAIIDDVVSYSYATWPLFESFPAQYLGKNVFGNGRYYNATSDWSAYTSPNIDLHHALKLNPNDVLSLRSVSWTVNFPRYNRDTDNADGDARTCELAATFPGVNVNAIADPPKTPADPMDPYWNDGDALEQYWDPVSIDFSVEEDPAAPKFRFYEKAAGDLKRAKWVMPAYAGGSNFIERLQYAGLDKSYARVAKGDQFRYRVHFNYDDTFNMPFYESPEFEDITFTFTRQPLILRWRISNS